MSARIEKRFVDLAVEGRAGLVTFVTAGDPGSVYAATTLRGGKRARTTHWTPYPASTPDCESCSHSSVGIMKWKRSFGFPEGVTAVVFRTPK